MMLLQYGLQLAEMMGALIRVSAEAMTLEMGLAGKLLETPGLFEPVITKTWLKWLWLDCLHYGLHIQTNLLEFQPNHSNDMELMRVFAQHGYRGQELSVLNQCHMFLQVI